MELLLMDTAMAGRLVGALCDTLLGSLWLGILLAVAAGVIVLCTRARSSALRYSLLVGVMKLGVPGGAASHRTGVSTGPGGYSGLPVMGEVSSGVFDGVSAYLNGHSNTIVLVWFMVICARSVQLAVGLYGTYRWKHMGVSVPAGGWRDRVAQLAAELGIKRCVTLLESGLARVPLVIGHLKPVILLPAGLLTALQADEIEAILLHELAHIRRSDYLVNLLQSLLEIVFFFNPAVWWVSGLIRTERENCCDDLALAEKNNMTGYIRALLSCEQYRQRVPAQAMAFPGGKDGLMARVMRMSGERNHSLSYVEKTLLAVGLVVCGLCWCAFLGKKEAEQVPKQVVRVGGKVVGREVVAKQAVAEKPVVVRKPVSAAVQGKVERGERKVETVRSRVAARYVEKSEEYGGAAGYYQGEGYAYPERVATEPTKEVEPTAATEPTREAEPTAANERTRVFGPAGVVGPNRVFGPTRIVEPTRVVGHVMATEPRYIDPRLAEIIADMLHDGLIVGKDNLDFLLSGTEFVINGVWQSEAVLGKYKKKYVPGNGENGWTWSHSQHNPVPRAFFH